MAENTEQLLIEVGINSDDAIKDAGKLTNEISELREETNKLKQSQSQARKEGQTNTDEYKKRSEQIAINEARVKNLSNALNNNQKIIRASTNEVRSEVGAYQQLQNNYALAAQRAKDLSVAYGENSEQARKAVATAKQMSDRLKEVDTSVGQNQRNVGNYTGAISSLSGSLGQMPGAFGKVASGANVAATGFEGLSATNPVGWIIILVNMVTSLTSTFMDFAPVADFVGNSLAKLGAIFSVLKNNVIGVITGQKSLGEALRDTTGDMAKQIAEAERLAEATRDLEDKQEALNVQQKLYKNEIDKLLLQSRNRTISEEERMKLIDKALEVETNAYNERKKLADDELRLVQDKLIQQGNLSASEAVRLRVDGLAYARDIENRKNLKNEEIKNLARALENQAAIDNESIQLREKAMVRRDKIEEDAENKAAKRLENSRAKRLADQQAQVKQMEMNLRIEQAQTETITEESAMNIWLAEKAINDQKISYGLMTNEEYKLSLIESEKRYNAAIMGMVQDLSDEAQKQIADDVAKQTKNKDDAAAKEIQRINTDFQNRMELSRASLDAEAEMQKQALETKRLAEVEAAEKNGADISLINQKYAEAELEIDRKKNEAKRNAASQLLGFVADAFGKATTAGKIAASAQIAIDSYSGAFAAFTGMVKAFPGPFGFVAGGVAAASIAASGVRAISDVWKVKEGERTVSRPSNSRSGISAPPAGSRGINSTFANQSAGGSTTGAVRSGVAAGLSENPFVPVLVTNDLTRAQRQRVEIRDGAML